MVDEEVSSRKEWKELCRQLSNGQERAMDSMERLSTEYALLQDKPKRRKVVEEMDKLEIEFLDTNDKEQVFLDSQKNELSSVAMDASLNIHRLHFEKSIEKRVNRKGRN